MFAVEPPCKPGETWRLVVKGHPVHQGDLTAYPIVHRTTKQPIIKNGRPLINTAHSNAAELKPWRNEIAQMAVANGWPAMGLAALDEALTVRLTFFFQRPASHFGTGKNAGVLKDSAPLYPEKTGADLDKLTRAVLDALTGLVWLDDRRIVTLAPRRRYGTPERLEIAVRRPIIQTVGDLRALRDLNPLRADTLADDLQLDLFGAAARTPTREAAPAA